jgi:hypothetical protein
MISPADLERLKADNPCTEVAAKYVKLVRGGKGLIGRCPACSQNRMAAGGTKFECWKDGWTCAGCNQGGDVIALVALAEKLDPKRDFRQVIGLLNGGAALLDRPPAPIDPEEKARAEAARDEARRQSEAEHDDYRRRERGRAFVLWEEQSRPIAGTLGEDYLRLRGLDPELIGQRLRFAGAARFYVLDPKPRLIHTGPALLAMIQRAGKFYGLHRTFIDLDRPKGKAVIVDPKTGAEPNAKKVRGSKKGGHIALLGPREPRELYLGEGIEKVGAVACALHQAGRDLTGSSFWTSVDLGNLGGKAASKLPHPFLKTERGRAQLVQGVEPDVKEASIIVPDSVERLVLLGDRTSERFETECAVVRAQNRYARPGRTIVAAWPPAGKDFDDVLREAA